MHLRGWGKRELTAVLSGIVVYTGLFGNNAKVMGDEQIAVGNADLARLLMVGSPTAGILPGAACGGTLSRASTAVGECEVQGPVDRDRNRSAVKGGRVIVAEHGLGWGMSPPPPGRRDRESEHRGRPVPSPACLLPASGAARGQSGERFHVNSSLETACKTASSSSPSPLEAQPPWPGAKIKMPSLAQSVIPFQYENWGA